MLKYLFWTVTAIYGAMSTIASVLQLVSHRGTFIPSIFMILGGIILMIAVWGSVKMNVSSIYSCGAGSLFIVISAIHNGLTGGDFHLSHHIVRIILSVLLTYGFYLLIKPSRK